MKKIYNSLYFKSALAGVINTVYLFFLTGISLKIIDINYRISVSTENSLHILSIFFISSIIFILILIKNADEFKSEKISVKVQILNFIFYSLLFIVFILMFVFKIIYVKKSVFFIFLLDSVLLCSGVIYSGYKLLRLIYRVVFLNIYTGSEVNYENKIYDILEEKEFKRELILSVKQSRRLGVKTGVILFHYNITEQLNIQEEKFIRKQIMFLLYQNSREYEPIGRNKDKNVYFKVIQYKDKLEFEYAVKRFHKILLSHNFMIYNKNLTFQIKILGISGKLFEKFNDVELNQEIGNILYSAVQKLKLLKRNFLIVDRLK